MTRLDAERYRARRQAAYDKTKETWADLPGPTSPIGLTQIGPAALDFWRDNWAASHPGSHIDGDFPWEDAVSNFRNNLNRFEVAIWSNDILCGLAIGRPSKGPDNVTIHLLERYWGANPFKGSIAAIAVDVADNYAKILEKQKVIIKYPVDGAIPVYEKLGFRPVQGYGKGAYYGREVD